jgi:hypothetical protein
MRSVGAAERGDPNRARWLSWSAWRLLPGILRPQALVIDVQTSMDKLTIIKSNQRQQAKGCACRRAWRRAEADGGARQGVMLTHGNLMAVVAGQLVGMDKMGEQIERPECPQRFTPNDVMISYLPLAHIFDRCALARASPTSATLCLGMTINLAALQLRPGPTGR